MPPSPLMESLDRIWRILGAIIPVKAIAGGLALSYWGYPRSTQDIDIAILLNNSAEFELISIHLRKSGLAQKGSAGLKNLGALSVSHWLFPMPEAYLDIELDLLFGDSEFFQTALARRVPCELFGTTQSMDVLSCEDLILFKALAGRMIDLADIRELKERNDMSLDKKYLGNWYLKLGIADS